MAEITVLTTNYNHEAFIGAAIESVINQSFEDWKMVILDDGSTDDSKDIIKKYALADKRITFISDNQNLKKSKRLNTYLENLDTPFTAFLDSDDVMTPHRLAIQLEVMKEHHDVGVCFTEGMILDSREDQSPMNVWGMNTGKSYFSELHGKPRIHGSTFENLLKGNFVFYSSTMIRTSAMKGLTFRDVSVGEDWLFWLDIARNWQFKYLEEPLTYYRLHGSNLMALYWEDEKFLESLEIVVNEQSKSMGKALLHEHYYALSRFFFRKSNKRKALHYGSAALRLSPFTIRYLLSYIQLCLN